MKEAAFAKKKGRGFAGVRNLIPEDEMLKGTLLISH